MSNAKLERVLAFTGDPDVKVPKILVDSDTIIFRAAAATDGRQYLVGKKAFKYKGDAVTYCKSKDIDPAEIIQEFYPEPVAHALGIVKNSIKRIREYAAKKYPDFRIKFFHTSDTNFRDTLLDAYKENRKDKRKPKHLQACKEYVEKRYFTDEREGLEADDLIGIYAYSCMSTGTPYLIVTNDKDLKTIPGDNYNWVTEEEISVSITSAMKFLYSQFIAGDSTDNIPGVDGLSINNKGTGKAQKIIDQAHESWVPPEGEIWTPEEIQMHFEMHLYDAALNAWLEGGPGQKGSYGCDSLAEVEEAFKASAQCLFILHNEGKLWEPPTNRNGGNFSGSHYKR